MKTSPARMRRFPRQGLAVTLLLIGIYSFYQVVAAVHSIEFDVHSDIVFCDTCLQLSSSTDGGLVRWSGLEPPVVPTTAVRPLTVLSPDASPAACLRTRAPPKGFYPKT
jgi:hypothetical protein